MTDETRIDPDTGETLTRGVRPFVVQYGPFSEVIDLPGWYPEGEGDSTHSDEDWKVQDRVVQELRARYAVQLKGLRERLGLTQEQAGVLFGGGPRAFQKYESGQATPTRSAVKLIEMVRRYPEMVEDLRAIHQEMEAAA